MVFAHSSLLGLSDGLSVSPAQIPAGTTLYDFIAHASEASWFSGAGALPFPGSTSDSRGFARYVDSALLEDGSTWQRVLETHPQWVSNGYITGTYPQQAIPPNTQLSVRIGFLSGATGTDGATFEVYFDEIYDQKQKRHTILSHTATYDKKLDSTVKDLGFLSGKTGYFILHVKAGQSSGQDWAAWAEARMEQVTIETPLPDLVATEISWTPSEPTVGDEVQVTVVVKNIGDGKAAACRGTLLAGNDLISSVEIQSLLPGGTETVSLTWTPGVEGAQELVFYVDYQKSVEEKNEGNNEIRGQVAVTGRLEIHPDSLPDATEGDYYSAKVWVTGGAGTYSWAFAGLPPGLRWQLQGQNDQISIYGTPEIDTHGTYSVEVSVRDRKGLESSKQYVLVVRELPWDFTVETSHLTEEGEASRAVIYVDALVIKPSIMQVDPETRLQFVGDDLFEVTARRTSGTGNKTATLELIAPQGTSAPPGIRMSISPRRGSVGDDAFISTISIRIDSRYPYVSEERELRLILRTRIAGVRDENKTIWIAIKGLRVDVRHLFAEPIQVVSSQRGPYVPYVSVEMVEGKSTIFNITARVVLNRVPVEPVGDIVFKVRLRLPSSEWDWEIPDHVSGTSMYSEALVTIPKTGPWTSASGVFIHDVSVYMPQSLAPKPKYVHFAYPADHTGPRRESGTAMLTVELDVENNIPELFEDDNTYSGTWYVRRTKRLRLLFIPWASGRAEYNCTWRRFYDSEDPPYAVGDNDDYLYHSHAEDDTAYGLFGAWTPDFLVVFPSYVGYAQTLDTRARALVEYVKATYPVSDDGISYTVVNAYTLVSEDHQWILEEVARRASVWDCDVGVAFRTSGGGGQSRGVKWAVFTDLFAPNTTLAHELYHLLAPMPYDDYAQHPASPGYWVDRGEVRGVGQSYFMASFGVSHPRTLLGGTNDSSRSWPPYFEWSWQSSHWIQREMYARLMNGWFNPLVSRDPLAVLVGGAVFKNGSAFLQPFVVQEVQDIDLLPNSTGDYRIVFLNGGGRVLSSYGFNASFAVLGDPKIRETNRSYFAYYVEMIDGLKRIELRDSSDKVLAYCDITPNAPKLELDLPSGGEKLTTLRNQTFTISWSASDEDGDKLYYYLAISPDNGTTWIPLGVDLTDTKFSLDV
ncbi:MAG: hypothetical protein OEW84_04600, partial [Aigarchaeota archaeon]|nr:hypothetical protein [Aigarchaeota archaeon]